MQNRVNCNKREKKEKSKLLQPSSSPSLASRKRQNKNSLWSCKEKRGSAAAQKRKITSQMASLEGTRRSCQPSNGTNSLSTMWTAQSWQRTSAWEKSWGRKNWERKSLGRKRQIIKCLKVMWHEILLFWNMLLIDAYMNLHYVVSKVWSLNFTQFAFMALFG